MIVVSNTSPIINLAAVGQLDLLRKLYGNVLIPESVRDEIVVAGKGQPGSHEVEKSNWIKSTRVQATPIVASLELELDKGEAEAIALSIELKADLFLLDEHKGRLVASRLGVRCVGLMGALMEAKQRGLISSVKPIVDDLIEKAGFWISHDLYKHVLHSAGE